MPEHDPPREGPPPSDLDHAPRAEPSLVSMVWALVAISGIAVLTLIAPDPWKFVTVSLGVAGAACWVVFRLQERRRLRDLREIASVLDRAAPAKAAIEEAGPRDRTLTQVLTRLARLPAGEAAPTEDRTEGESLRRLLDAISVPVIDLSAAGVIRRANRSTHALLGRGRADLVGARLDDLFPGDETATLHDQASGGTPARGRVRVVLGEGARYFDVSATPTSRESDGWGVTLTFTDVTELATAVQLKSDFAANASHELRTPIAIMRGAVDTLATTDASDPADSELINKMISIVANNVSRLEEMVSDLLALSRLESSAHRDAPAQCSAADLAANLDELTAGACAERGVTLRFDLHPDLERMLIDPQLLELILRNLIENAIKFSHTDGEVLVVGRPADIVPVRTETAPAQGLRPKAKPGLTGARFRVIDEGVGIPLRDQTRIFERFYQVDQSRNGTTARRGTGLGLAIVKHAVRRLEGSVRVESVWQEGTTMSVEIPNCVVMPGHVGPVGPVAGPTPPAPPAAPRA